MKTVPKNEKLSRPDFAVRNDRLTGARKVFRNWQLYVMLLPALAYIICFAYFPMYGVQIAFRNFNFKGGITGSPWVGWANFDRLFSSYWFPIIFKNTLTLSSLSLVLSFQLPIIFALMANELRNEKLKRTLQTVSYAPHFISTVVMCGMLILLLSPSSGIVNNLITLCGGEPVQFLGDSKKFKWVYVLSGIWQGTGWASIIYFSALSAVDKEILEAAEIDGANRMQRIWFINLPVLVPTIMIQFILSCGSIMSVGYEKVFLLQNNANLVASEVISTYVYKVGLEQFSYSFSAAVGVFNSVVNCIMLITVNFIARKTTKQSLW